MITVPSVNVLCIKIFFVIPMLEFLHRQATVCLKGPPLKGLAQLTKNQHFYYIHRQ